MLSRAEYHGLMRIAVLPLLALGLAACASSYDPDSPERAGDAPEANRRVQETIDVFLNADPGLKRFFDNAYGYAVFWRVGKAGIGVGGAHGNGLVYEQGKAVGNVELIQGTVGLQLGGQVYREIIFFENRRALSDLQDGDFELSAQASAVAASDGASRNAAYRNGVAVFTVGNEGLMFEASVGGQKFNYSPLP